MALTREVPAAVTAALAGHFHPTVLIEAEWADDQVIRLHSGVGQMVWGGHTWSGVSARVDGRLISLVQIELPEEVGGLATGEAVVHVAAGHDDMLAEKGRKVRNLAINIRFGVTTERAGATLVGDPVLLFSGYYASKRFSFSGSFDQFVHDMSLGLGVGPSARSQASITHSYEDQVAKHPGDTAGRHVQHAIKRSINPSIWPEP